MLIAGAASAAAAPTVRIVVDPVREAIHEYDPDAEPTDSMPVLDPGRVAATTCDFWCKPVLSHRLRSTTLESTGCAVEVEVIDLHLVVELTTTTWLPVEASRLLIRHARGHRAICDRIYSDSRATLEAALAEVDTSTLRGNGVSCADAIGDAVRRQASLTYCIPYTSTLGGAARRVQEIYDFLARSGAHRALRPEEALAGAFSAFDQERAESPP